jgi:hypothetical protein
MGEAGRRRVEMLYRPDALGDHLLDAYSVVERARAAVWANRPIDRSRAQGSSA